MRVWRFLASHEYAVYEMMCKTTNWWFIYDTVLWLIVIHLSNSPVKSSILWVRVYHYRSVDLALSVKVNLFDMFPCCCCSSMAWTRCCLGVWKKDGGRCLGWWLSGSDITLRKSQGLVKKHSYFMQAVCTLLWTGLHIPRPLLSWKSICVAFLLISTWGKSE